MLQRQLTGSRIRARRLDRGLQQAQLAGLAGISPSYLNLIEHNRRRIGGKLLNSLARALGVDPGALAVGAEGALIDRLRLAAAQLPEAGAEVERTEDFAGRFAGWSALVAAQAEQLALIEARVAELTDRLAHDPQLATSLHAVISAVTSIRSTAAILAGNEALDRDWQDRFHRNIHADSIRLAESSRELVNYLEGPQDGAPNRSPQEQVAAWLEATDHHVPALEDDTATVAAVVAGAGMQSPAAAQILQSWLQRYRDDAQAMPLAAFAQAAREMAHDPVRLAARFGTDLAAVLRRMAALPPDPAHPQMGLAICDSAGGIIALKPVAGFSLPRNGAACPLWPLYQVLSQPGRPLRALVQLPGDRGGRFLCYAVAQPRGAVGFDSAPVSEATMLVLPDAPEGSALQPVGITCRICPRMDCVARREPSVLG